MICLLAIYNYLTLVNSSQNYTSSCITVSTNLAFIYLFHMPLFPSYIDHWKLSNGIVLLPCIDFNNR